MNKIIRNCDKCNNEDTINEITGLCPSCDNDNNIENLKNKRYYVMFEGKELGMIKARNYNSALNKITDIVSLEVDTEDE